MRTQARHLKIALSIALLLLAIATVVARVQDFSGYSGARLYARFCASCHGIDGHGDGPVADSFRVIVPDLTRIARRRGGEFPREQIRKIIDGRSVLPPHGSREMPVWGFEFYAQNAAAPDAQKRTEEMIARLTEHVRSMQRD